MPRKDRAISTGCAGPRLALKSLDGGSMINLQYSDFQSIHSTKTHPSGRGLGCEKTFRQHEFADASYLRRVIANLEAIRKQQRVGLQEATRRAGLRKGVIGQAVKHGVIPPVREFKAWSRALGIPWEELCSTSFPTRKSEILSQGCGVPGRKCDELQIL